ncbi:hypothetical protein L2E82_01649 [Cichorium intybus]|uniref:Uncharacterized protein n=1 Tax=Cichorium intybus TaxID=13427 RepID=A0ACB9GZJ4_CICIN|nr:hypothetical protein L2E82_01649 [Cichorium intybus]
MTRSLTSWFPHDDVACFPDSLFAMNKSNFDLRVVVRISPRPDNYCTYAALADFQYFFTSFLSRDEAFKLISDGCLEHGNGSKAISDQQDSRPGLIDEEPEIVMVEDSDESRPLADDLETTNRVQDVVDDDSIVVQNTDCSPSGKSLAWEVEYSNAPNVPDGYTLAAESTFPIRWMSSLVYFTQMRPSLFLNRITINVEIKVPGDGFLFSLYCMDPAL